jgi:predicted DNA-binding transcriptional regulator YafY
MARAVSTEVLGLLSDGESWTGARLAGRLGVGLRTVRRAVARLRAEGIVIEADSGPGGGMRLLRRAGLPRLRLEHEEAVGLLLSLAVAESLGLALLGKALRPLRAKLGQTLREQERGSLGLLRRRILVGAPASPAVRESWRRPAPDAAQALQDAFVSRSVVRFDYRDERQHASTRHVEPQYLLLNHPAWYLLGYDRGRSAGRTFRIDRIGNVSVTGERFGSRSAASLSAHLDDVFEPL